MASAVAGAATVFFIAAAGHHLLDPPNVLGVFFALFMAGCYSYGIARAGAVPWKWLVAAAIFLSGTLVAFLPAAVVQPLVAGSPATHDSGHTLLVALFPYFLVWTPLFLISGSITLVLYLRGTHLPAPDGQ